MKLICINPKCIAFNKVKERAKYSEEYSCWHCDQPMRFPIKVAVKKQNEIAKQQLREMYGS